MINKNKQLNEFCLFIKKILILSPIFLLIPIINYTGALFSKGKEKFYAQQLLDGKCLYDSETPIIDERLLHKHLIENFSDSKQIIVFGSSRSRQIYITPYLKHYKSSFTHGLSGGVLKDFIMLYNFYKSKKTNLPKILILECSPWWLNKNDDDLYATWNIENNTWQTAYETICDLYSPIILQTTLKVIIEKYLFNSIAKTGYLFPDGHRYYQKIQVSEVQQNVSNQTVFLHFNNFYELNKDSINEFDKFVKTIINDNVRVIFFLPPYHPVSYQKLKSNPAYKMVFKAEDFFIKLAKKHGIETVGAYNPTQCNCDETDFFDWHHTYETSTPKIFGQISKTF